MSDLQILYIIGTCFCFIISSIGWFVAGVESEDKARTWCARIAMTSLFFPIWLAVGMVQLCKRLIRSTYK